MKVPTYSDASKRRLVDNHTAMDLFVSEWEPSMRTHDQYEIARWREDLSWVVAQVEMQRDEYNIDENRRYVMSVQDREKAYENLIGGLLLLFCGSLVLNMVLYFL